MIKFGSNENNFYGATIYDDPKVIVCNTWSIANTQEEKTILNPIVEQFSGLEVTWLAISGWLADVFSYKKIINAIKEVSDKHNIIFLIGSYEELNNLKSNNIECILANHNQFLNRKHFSILELNKKYNAVYNGGFFDYKRHHLASKIKNLALISRGNGDEKILNTVKNFENVYLPNFDNGYYKWMQPEEVNKIYNESYCGLCLSKTEGAMKACIEYLLSGIPVVTTLNKGGRDFFLDGRFSLWVEDNPSSIAEAVECFIKSKINPYLIRNETIKKLDHANEVFVQELCSLLSLDENKLKSKLSGYDYYLTTERPIKEI